MTWWVEYAARNKLIVNHGFLREFLDFEG